MSKRRPNEDQPGNAMASALAVQRQLLKQAELINRAETMLERAFDKGVDIQGIKISAPNEGRDNYFVVITGLSDEGFVVAFHDGETFAEALTGTLQRIENGTLKWKMDEYRNR